MKQKESRVFPRGGFVPSLFVVLACLASPLAVQTNVATQGKAVATVGQTIITEEELHKAAAAELENLLLQKLQFETRYQRDRHDILEKTLANLINEKIVEAEAVKRETTKSELLASEVDSKIIDPSPEQVAAFYEDNRRQIGRPIEEVSSAIRRYLREQQRDQVYDGFIARLKEDYKSTLLLEPLRADVETEGHPSRGPAGAPITLVEFSDFQCVYCGSLVPTLQRVLKEYPDTVRIVYRQFPLSSIHPQAQKAGEASLCANDQGSFWEMHDAIFEAQGRLTVDELKAKAVTLKLQSEVFNECIDSGKHAGRVRQDLIDGTRLGVSGTPALFINGRFFEGVRPYDELVKVFEEELARIRNPR